MTQDANNVYVQTTQAGGFPQYNPSTSLALNAHPAPKVTFNNCSATAPAGTSDNSIAYSLSQAPAGAPLWSYSKYTYNGSAINQGAHQKMVWGTLLSLKMNVTKPYSGPNPK